MRPKEMIKSSWKFNISISDEFDIKYLFKFFMESGPLPWIVLSSLRTSDLASGFKAHIVFVNIVTCMSDYRRGLDWWLDLFYTLTHDSWLHFIIHSYTHTSILSLLQSPLVVLW
jgi:hypothetical protein